MNYLRKQVLNKMTKDSVGLEGEKLALKFLRKQGYKIIEHSFRCRYGEIDLVAYKKGMVSFIEVKTRTNPEFGQPEESVRRPKQNRMAKIALYYLKKKRLADVSCNFGVVSIRLKGNRPEIQLFENAFAVNEVLPRRMNY